MRIIRIGIFESETTPTDGGANTLLKALRERLPHLPQDQAIELVPVPWSEWSFRRRPFRFAAMRLLRPLGVELPLVNLRPVCRRLRLDAAYFPSPAFVQIDVPFVFTFWDAGHRTIPEFPEVRCARDPWTQREAMYRQLLPQASFVVVGNETGAMEAASLYGVLRERIAVLPFPNPDFASISSTPPAWLPTRPFFLYPAQFWPHKNHATLIRAMALLARQNIAADLVFVGSDKGNGPYLKDAAAEFGVSDRVHFGGFVSRGELKALYERAVGLAFASLLGPNNLPPQEAAVLGCPVLLSDLPGHREQLRDGAHYVDALDASAWAAAMANLLRHPEQRQTLAIQARLAVAGCTGEAYAAGLQRLFLEMARRRGLWGDDRSGRP